MNPLAGRDIVCFSNDWDGDPLSKTHIMRILARESRILWVNSIGNRAVKATANDARRIWSKLRAAARGVREVERNIHVLAPLYLPAYGVEAVRTFNRHALSAQVRLAMRTLGLRRPVSWSFLPSAATVAGTLGEELVIYHVVDEFSAFSDASPHVRELEERLCRRADLVIASAEPLREAKRRFNPATVLVRHGVDLAHFSTALDAATPIPEDIARLPKPVIGFFGLVADWIDLPLVRKVADENPGASVVLIGKVATDLGPLAGAKNVYFLGRKPYAQLPGYCRAFDVAITPFVRNELAFHANPLKAREYVAAGLPNVCTDLPELRQVPGCTIAEDDGAFLAAVRRALADPGPRRARSELMRSESWEAKVDEIRGHVGAALQRVGRGRLEPAAIRAGAM